jgi:hypothetical protein
MLQARKILKISTIFLSVRLKGEEHLADLGLYVVKVSHNRPRLPEGSG